MSYGDEHGHGNEHLFWGLLAALTVIGIVIGKRSETLEEKKKRHQRNTNIVGGFVLATVAVAILCTMIVGWIRTQNDIEYARREAVKLSDEFAKGNMVEIMAWAKGERIDPWENSYILEVSSDSKVVMLSMGPDGEHPTEDDIRGHSKLVPVNRIKDFEKIKEEQPGMLDKFKFWSDKKEVEVEKEVEPEEEDDPGLFDSIKHKFKWSWNNEDE